MKQRFSISRNTGGEKIVIKEYGELDKGVYSLLCEESYSVETVEAALAKGPDKVITLLRTESFFPISCFAEKLIATLCDYLRQGNTEVVKIDADDTECIHNRSMQDPQAGNEGIDALLGVDTEEIVEDEAPAEKLEAPIKIAEVETVEASNSL